MYAPRMGNPCQSCGACCAHFRVSFYWSEAEPFLGGQVPIELTEQLDRHHLCMRGTNQKVIHCIALDGSVGQQCSCTIYPQRPTPCRQLEPFDSDGNPTRQCLRARAAHGLPPLSPDSNKPLTPSPPIPLRA